MHFHIGEALVGDGNEVAHIDLMIGSKNGPVGTAFANALANQSEGHTNLLAVLEPNVAVKPSTVMITKVTIKGMKQAVQMFGPAQAAVAQAVADAVSQGIIPRDAAEELVCVCGVFIHPAAEDDEKIYKYNYEATLESLKSALANKPSVDDMLAKKDSAAHPFKGF
ncbi:MULTISPECIES: formaldehyde-activating enzyme [Pirellulaceae]|uniref:5,6,7,8-tetrahydromethanopterin hydro-lyase n=1 Tax=Aporhodopirellula rubra TaxID=980271 RepID=A0A7W5DX94_9BACT|nr:MULTISPECIES: formaldehyde-activating enzyme [Pirellulaceae]EMI45624.1 bifunctional formaldehyde-activating enzyme/3-hexulose-6-phosphate synthase [Rhodopirellula sp. SWK7]MBB3205738.1 5,6,7,8-tetrahydromethanopterin hydro-lyase [Aporhodopirellula rubra]